MSRLIHWKPVPRAVATALSGVVAAAIAGCDAKIQRENVLATTQSAVGLMVGQNPQTQMYEMKIGYARNEFFLVPTSKRVVNDANDKDAAGTCATPSNFAAQEHWDPSSTPEVLAEIQVGGQGKQTIGATPNQSALITVYQRLAVGKEAVGSRAAVALMSHDAATAMAAARIPESPSVESVRPILAMVSQLVEVLRADPGKTAAAHVAALEGMAKRLNVGISKVTLFSLNGAAVEGTPTSTVSFSGIDPALEYIGKLANSVTILKSKATDANGMTATVAGAQRTYSQEEVQGLERIQSDLMGRLLGYINSQAEFIEAVRYTFPGAARKEN